MSYVPRYCIECLFYKQLGESFGRCLAWRNDRLPYGRICRRFAEYKHFDPFTGQLVETQGR